MDAVNLQASLSVVGIIRTISWNIRKTALSSRPTDFPRLFQRKSCWDKQCLVDIWLKQEFDSCAFQEKRVLTAGRAKKMLVRSIEPWAWIVFPKNLSGHSSLISVNRWAISPYRPTTGKNFKQTLAREVFSLFGQLFVQSYPAIAVISISGERDDEPLPRNVPSVGRVRWGTGEDTSETWCSAVMTPSEGSSPRQPAPGR